MSRRRRPRAVYRVYGEEEYLAGADALTTWEESPADELKHGRRLQRIAGAAALTGAVGTVGGVVGLAGLRAHAVDRREIAERVVSPVRTAALQGHVSTTVHVAHRRPLHASPSWRMHTYRRTKRVSPGSASRAETAARAIAVNAAQRTPPRVTSAVQGAPTETASTEQEAPSAIAARPRAQSEFGFER